jgi:hypothetical protein
MAGEDPAHLRKLRHLPCAVVQCLRKAEDAHHPTGTRLRGMSQKSHDHDAIPMCHRCHMDFHAARGFFKHMKKQERREWQDTMSARYCPRPPAEGIF